MELITLQNGLRIALQQNDFARSVAMHLYINCGSRNETEVTAGSSHFLEHMIFKGTEEIDFLEINQEFDAMGGQFNAYTSKEHTCVYCQVLEADAPKALDLILKIVTEPKLSEEELQTEKGVILEELSMYEDSPEDLAAEALCSLVYGSHPLGRPVIGSKESIKAITSDSLRGYRKKFYSPERMVLSICGKFQKQALLEVAERHLAPLEKDKDPATIEPAPWNGGICLKTKDFEQTQVILASPSFPAGSDMRYAAAIFSAIAGGNSSSRLNMRIREQLGLAYSVYSCNYAHRGAGFFMVSAGTAHETHLEVIKEILKIMDNIAATITPEEIERVKSQFKASTVMGGESNGAIAAAMGKELLYSGRYTDIDGVAEKIAAVSYGDVMAAAEFMWQKEKLALCVVGKPLQKSDYQSIM